MKELSRIPTRVFIAFFGQDYFYSDTNLYRPFTRRILIHHKEGNWRELKRTGDNCRELERTGERTEKRTGGNCRGLERTRDNYIETT